MSIQREDRKFFHSILKREIEKHFKESNNLEFEIRFYELLEVEGKFPPIAYGTFQRVLNYFKEKYDFTEASSMDYNVSENSTTHRKTIFSSPQSKGEKEKVEYVSKTNLSRNINNDFAIRIAVSKEITSATSTKIEKLLFLGDKKKDVFIRRKERTTFQLGSASLDMTIVTSPSKGSKNEKDDKSFEIELEMSYTQYQDILKFLDKFADTAQEVWKVIHDTEFIFSIPEREMFISYINNTIAPLTTSTSGGKKYRNKQTVERIHSDARNLKLRDMVSGGLCLGKWEYNVTDKADGERTLIVFSPWGILLSKSRSLNLLYPYNLNLGQEKKIYTGFIIDAEMVTTFQQERIALVFDLLSIPYKMTVTPNAIIYKENTELGSSKPLTQKFNEREKLVQDFIEIWKLHLKDDIEKKKINFKILKKDFFAFRTPQEFYYVMDSISKLSQVRQYKTDGFIFTPVNMSYQMFQDYPESMKVRSDYQPLEERVLTEFPDICKLKPVDELTIDFTFDPSSPKNEQLYSWDSKNKELVLFSSSEVNGNVNSDSEVNVDREHVLLENINSPTVIEFKWDFTSNLFVPTRLRLDKPVPNKLEIALDIWNDIFNPIEPKTFLGYDDTLMAEYHLREFTRYLSGLNKTGGVVLLSEEIGLIDPDEYPSLTFLSETDLGKGKSKASKKKINFAFVYNSNFTRTFNQKLVGKILEHIESDGLIFYITVTGETIQQILSLAGKQSMKLSNFATITDKPSLTYNYSEEEEKTFEGEFLTIDNYIELFADKHFKPSIIQQLDEEQFLNPFEFILSSLFTLMVFKKNPKQNIRKPLGSPVKRKLEVLKTTPPEVVNEEEEISEEKEEVSVSSEEEAEEVSEAEEEEVSVSNEEEEVNEESVSNEEADEVSETMGEIDEEGISEEIFKAKIKRFRGVLRDDKVEDLVVPWFNGAKDEQVVRIGTIGDGHCFIHSVLKSILPVYSFYTNENEGEDYYTSQKDKIMLAERFRSGLGENLFTIFTQKGEEEFRTLHRKRLDQLENIIKKKLGKADRTNEFDQNDLKLRKDRLIAKYLLLEETIFWKYFGEIYKQYKEMDEADREEIFGNYIPTIEGLYELLISNNFLGDEVYAYIADQLNIDIIILRATYDNLEHHTNSLQLGRIRRVIVINGTGAHYEVIGLKNAEEEGIETNFERNHPFIEKIISHFDLKLE